MALDIVKCGGRSLSSTEWFVNKAHGSMFTKKCSASLMSIMLATIT